MFHAEIQKKALIIYDAMKAMRKLSVEIKDEMKRVNINGMCGASEAASPVGILELAVRPPSLHHIVSNHHPTEHQQTQHSPANMLAKFFTSVASVISSFTVYSTVIELSSFRVTAFNARSAASSASVPVERSIPRAYRTASSVNPVSPPVPWTRLTLTSLAVLAPRYIRIGLV